jgi:hypothetical protein
MFSFCSQKVKGMSSEEKRRFPAPWTVVKASDDCHVVKDAKGITVAWVYSRDDLHRIKWSYAYGHLTSDEARRIANAIARLPELMSDRKETK